MLIQSNSDLFRARSDKRKWKEPENIVPAVIFRRRPPKFDERGELNPRDTDGLSIGFSQREDWQKFRDRTQTQLTICGVVSLPLQAVLDLGLGVEPTADDPRHGNITGMPFTIATDAMTEEQKAEVNPDTAYYLESELAKISTILERW